MDVVSAAQRLVQIPSVTSVSNLEAADCMRQWLQDLEFEVECLDYVDGWRQQKRALAAVRRPVSATNPSPGIGFFCHNDVVSTEGWNAIHGGPFEAVVADGRLWGRGACDMKGPTAAALTAIQQIPHEQQFAPIYVIVTGDEECGMAGARWVAEHSHVYRDMVERQAVGIIGEPTEMQVVNAHKGGCHFDVSSSGVVAHSSTADGRNANWQLIPYLSYLERLAERCQTDPRLKNERFSPSTLSLNIAIENRPAAPNITVGRAECKIFFRPMPDTGWRDVLDEMVAEARRSGLEVSRFEPLLPLDTPEQSPFVQRVLGLMQQNRPRAVCFATDGCCFQELRNLVVLGPGSIEQAHRPDEWIELDELKRGEEAYHRVFAAFALL